MGAAEINRFLSHLATDLNVAASTQNQALSAVLFLYRHVLKVDVGKLGEVVRAKRPARLPVVLSVEEVERVISRMSGRPRLMALLEYVRCLLPDRTPDIESRLARCPAAGPASCGPAFSPGRTAPPATAGPARP
jgi:hypothetical protein